VYKYTRFNEGNELLVDIEEGARRGQKFNCNEIKNALNKNE